MGYPALGPWWNTIRLHSELDYRAPQEIDKHYTGALTSNTCNNKLGTSQEQNPGRFTTHDTPPADTPFGR